MTFTHKSITRIEVSNSPDDNSHHTIVQFDNGAYQCSCGVSSQVNGFFYKAIPNFRVDSCVVCGNPSWSIVHELDDSHLCLYHDYAFNDWTALHPSDLPMDFIREQVKS